MGRLLKKFRKRRQAPFVSFALQATTPQQPRRLPTTDLRAAYRLGAAAGINSVLMLDFKGRHVSGVDWEQQGLRDDWISLGNDLRIVMSRTTTAIERDELDQPQLFPDSSRDPSAPTEPGVRE